MALSPKQLRFVEEFVVDLNATQAAIRAGYSPKTAAAQGSRLLKNVEVQQAIAQRQAQVSQSAGVRAEDVLRQLMRIGFCDIRKAYDEKGNLLPIKDLPDDIALAVSGIDVEEIQGPDDENPQTLRVRKLRFPDRNKALELLGKHLKLWVDKVEHSADGSFAEMLKAARERARS